LIVLIVGLVGTTAISALYNYFAQGQRPSIYGLASIAASLIVTLIIPIAEQVWRPIWRLCPFLSRRFFPDLNGTWTGHLQTTWRDPSTGEMPGPIPATFWIEQGLFRVNVRMRTGESRSRSTRCLVEADRGGGIYRLYYSYHNRPKAEVAERSARHDGSAWLELDLDAGDNRLVGQYFTERKTQGDIELRRISLAIPERPADEEIASAPKATRKPNPRNKRSKKG
jgi:hypothetical protein